MNGDEDLAAMVEAAFPALPMNDWRVDRSGGDHLLLLTDDIVFRFPRAGTHDLALEIAVLHVLEPKLQLATPAYEYIDPAGRFAGYRYLHGDELTPARFAALSQPCQDELVKDAASFLSGLHRLAPEEVAPLARWPKTWTAAQFGMRAQSERLEVLAKIMPNGIGAIERFYTAYRHDQPLRLVVVHGDLVPEHILVDGSGRLSGIIDFGDVGLGDPAQDFLGFWAYGEDIVRRIAALYEAGRGDPGLLARSRDHFIRYSLDEMYENFGNPDFDMPLAIAAIEVRIAPAPAGNAFVSWIDKPAARQHKGLR